MRIGYARVSTTEQNLDLQRDALKRSGCERIIEETASGGKVQRSGLERVQEMLRQGDVLAVWRLDRLGRSLKHLTPKFAEGKSTNTFSASSFRTSVSEAQGLAARPGDPGSLCVERGVPHNRVMGSLVEMHVDMILGDAHSASGLDDLPA
jgi:hypothetical protein